MSINKKSFSDAAVGIVAGILLFLIVFSIVFGLYLLITHLIIWVIKGIFNYDLSNSFWQVFTGTFLITLLFKPSFSININK